MENYSFWTISTIMRRGSHRKKIGNVSWSGNHIKNSSYLWWRKHLKPICGGHTHCNRNFYSRHYHAWRFQRYRRLTSRLCNSDEKCCFQRIGYYRYHSHDAVLFCCLYLSIYANIVWQKGSWRLFHTSLNGLLLMVAMMLAFFTGTFAVLMHSSDLSIATCVIDLCFFVTGLFISIRCSNYLRKMWKMVEFWSNLYLHKVIKQEPLIN